MVVYEVFCDLNPASTLLSLWLTLNHERQLSAVVYKIIYNMQGGNMKQKQIDWRGSSLEDLKDDNMFTPNARREAGHQLSQVQVGLEPDHWKPFNEVGAGTKEIIIDLDRWMVQGNVGSQISRGGFRTALLQEKNEHNE